MEDTLFSHCVDALLGKLAIFGAWGEGEAEGQRRHDWGTTARKPRNPRKHKLGVLKPGGQEWFREVDETDSEIDVIWWWMVRRASSQLRWIYLQTLWFLGEGGREIPWRLIIWSSFQRFDHSRDEYGTTRRCPLELKLWTKIRWDFPLLDHFSRYCMLKSMNATIEWMEQVVDTLFFGQSHYFHCHVARNAETWSRGCSGPGQMLRWIRVASYRPSWINRFRYLIGYLLTLCCDWCSCQPHQKWQGFDKAKTLIHRGPHLNIGTMARASSHVCENASLPWTWGSVGHCSTNNGWLQRCSTIIVVIFVHSEASRSFPTQRVHTPFTFGDFLWHVTHVVVTKTLWFGFLFEKTSVSFGFKHLEKLWTKFFAVISFPPSMEKATALITALPSSKVGKSVERRCSKFHD